jgi:ABC-2 type transport system ATP-binding protein
VEEFLAFIADARQIPAKERTAKTNAAVEACGLGSVRDRRIEALSKGYKQRAGLAQAIIHDPPILILDEPTTGLDPNQIIEIRGLITELGKRKTVILSTHILQEVEAICSRVLILNEGRIAAQGTPEEISGTMKGGETWSLCLKSAGNTVNAETIRTRLETLKTTSGAALETVKTEAGEGGQINAAFFIPQGSRKTGVADNGAADNGERIFDWAVGENLKILGMSRKKLSLEDIFVKLTNEGPVSDTNVVSDTAQEATL